ncbi:hypothetical protein [Methanomethylophilus alvi]|uniref:hypothetical protein n=1 Tax=Methanomethylophilus alvi TaxID=1291540 RepID=UPI0037DD8718
MSDGRYKYSIKPGNREKLLRIQAFVLLEEHKSAELSELINIAIERMFDGIVEDLQKDGGKYKLMLAEMLQSRQDS